MPYPFHTIGHSTRSIAEFVALLRVGDIALVVDIRTVRRSRANPQFNSEVLPESLAAFGIGYERIAELGGLRGKAHDIPPTLNAFWINQSFQLEPTCVPRQAAAMRHHVLGNALVALSQQNRRGLSCDFPFNYANRIATISASCPNIKFANRHLIR